MRLIYLWTRSDETRHHRQKRPFPWCVMPSPTFTDFSSAYCTHCVRHDRKKTNKTKLSDCIPCPSASALLFARVWWVRISSRLGSKCDTHVIVGRNTETARPTADANWRCAEWRVMCDRAFVASQSNDSSYIQRQFSCRKMLLHKSSTKHGPFLKSWFVKHKYRNEAMVRRCTK